MFHALFVELHLMNPPPLPADFPSPGVNLPGMPVAGGEATPDAATPQDAALPVAPTVESRPTRLLRRFGHAFDTAFGLASLVAGLAVLSIIPLLNFLSLGYLLHASGRVAVTGRLRDGLVGLRQASRVGSAVAGVWLLTLPVRLVAGLWQDAELIAPGSRNARGWHLALFLLLGLTLLQGAWALIRGGRLRHFLWPAPLRAWRWLRTPGQTNNLWPGLVGFVVSLRLPHFFWLGARAFVGTVLWLLLPVGCLLAAAQLPPDRGGALLSLLGGLLLTVVALHLPFLQAHFAVEGRFRALFAVRTVRRQFQHAPIAFWFALLITLLFALPLYLLRIELPPRELAWAPSLLFVLFIFPARLLTGWALGRARRHTAPRHGVIRWLSRLAVVPVVLLYVLVVYLTQYLSWDGTRSLLEQHAFMVPAPLTSL
jgi:hypothetical protein